MNLLLTRLRMVVFFNNFYFGSFYGVIIDWLEVQVKYFSVALI